eukprot:TRINITY_DN8733_c0_g1_i1.p1 TRINITY_DN8733_c0_g1~~TRINITY_DN8733_c0_g1_i1.p1  ORF type:complete len:247 (+),score=25.76 TRINITY_DN8733_c0_g1_i1:26-742(+)
MFRLVRCALSTHVRPFQTKLILRRPIRAFSEKVPEFIERFNKCVEAGDVNALFLKATLLLQGGKTPFGIIQRNFPEARSLLRRCADAGHKEACYAYGKMLRIGSGGSEDVKTAKQYIEKALALAPKHLGATYEMGKIFMHHDFNDPKLAREFIVRAAKEGYIVAAPEAVQMLREGIGGEKDLHGALTIQAALQSFRSKQKTSILSDAPNPAPISSATATDTAHSAVMSDKMEELIKKT